MYTRMVWKKWRARPAATRRGRAWAAEQAWRGVTVLRHALALHDAPTTSGVPTVDGGGEVIFTAPCYFCSVNQ